MTEKETADLSNMIDKVEALGAQKERERIIQLIKDHQDGYKKRSIAIPGNTKDRAYIKAIGEVISLLYDNAPCTHCKSENTEYQYTGNIGENVYRCYSCRLDFVHR